MASPINETVIIEAIPFLAPLVENIRALVASLQWMVGGIFGIYMILVYLRWRESRMVGKLLKDIRLELKHINEKIDSISGKKLSKKKSK